MTRVAAIDIGTNTVRLLIAEPPGEAIERDLEITRLGRDVDAARSLRADAIDRTVGVVAGFVERARSAGASVVRIAGTSAMRDADNAAEFVRAVEDATGVSPEILSGEDEGRLAFLGATSWLGDGRFVVCDIGGGSTELIVADGVRSADVGSVRVRERFLASDPPRPDEIAAARAFVRGEIAAAGSAAGVTGTQTLVGVAGTITTLAALVLGLARYDPERVHGTLVGAESVKSWSERLLAMTVADIRELPSMHPGRADVIGSGVLILREVVEHWGFAGVLVSERDILDGLVLTCGGRSS